MRAASSSDRVSSLVSWPATPGSVVGGALLGVVGAILAVPVAASLLLLHREVFLKRQDAR